MKATCVSVTFPAPATLGKGEEAGVAMAGSDDRKRERTGLEGAGHGTVTGT